MKKVSLLEQALEFAGAHAGKMLEMGRVNNISRRDFDERETFAFRAQEPCLEYLSLLIENQLLLRTNRTGRVYAGFEKLSHLKPVVERYLRIADVSERVYVFGVADWQPPRHPNLRVIDLDLEARLARECFLIADSSTLRVALMAQEEQEEQGAAALGDETRHFRALKSSDSAIVSRLSDLAEELIDTTRAA